MLNEALELAAEDRAAGRGIVFGCPVAYALASKAYIQMLRCEFGKSEELLEEALRIAAEQADPEIETGPPRPTTRARWSTLASSRPALVRTRHGLSILAARRLRRAHAKEPQQNSLR
jgi:hypothetical protein